jgi:predicted CoA-binding protein
MNQAIEEFIAGKHIALVGASQNPKKFGTTLFTELRGRGYQVELIHPTAKEIAGQSCYPSLAALPGKVDSVLVCVKPAQVEDVLRQAANAGVKRVWLQQGAESPAALRLANELGLTVVSGKCILMYAPPVKSFHSFHRFFVKLTGQY